VRYAAQRVPKARDRILHEIERADAGLQSAFLDIDPDLRADRTAKRAAATQRRASRVVKAQATLRARAALSNHNGEVRL
jgi:hypothetical protein